MDTWKEIEPKSETLKLPRPGRVVVPAKIAPPAPAALGY